ncbi:MAG: SAM-dependent methyltransferase [Xanthobacteraceae bacterium]|jgi:SAM-dependent methyltransferase
MKPIDVAGFERKFRENIDPWDYASSDFERFKRRVLIQSCGLAKYGRVLELGCANGETTRALKRISLRLLAVDGSMTAIAAAKRRLRGSTHVSFSCLSVPEAMPRGPFDLIIISELAYYLPPHRLSLLGRRISANLAYGGRAVVLNHRRMFGDAAQHPSLAHRRLIAHLERSLELVDRAEFPRFAVASLVRRQRTRSKHLRPQRRAW